MVDSQGFPGRLGRYLCEVRAGQFWRLENLGSFDGFLERRFPESRRKACYLMAIHERLTQIPQKGLKQVGWTKAAKLVKVARREGQRFESAVWLHKAGSMSFRRALPGQNESVVVPIALQATERAQQNLRQCKSFDQPPPSRSGDRIAVTVGTPTHAHHYPLGPSLGHIRQPPSHSSGGVSSLLFRPQAACYAAQKIAHLYCKGSPVGASLLD